jgi:hypothetical protein
MEPITFTEPFLYFAIHTEEVCKRLELRAKRVVRTRKQLIRNILFG